LTLFSSQQSASASQRPAGWLVPGALRPIACTFAAIRLLRCARFDCRLAAEARGPFSGPRASAIKPPDAFRPGTSPGRQGPKTLVPLSPIQFVNASVPANRTPSLRLRWR
jgi:hypothetical protein